MPLLHVYVEMIDSLAAVREQQVVLAVGAEAPKNIAKKEARYL